MFKYNVTPEDYMEMVKFLMKEKRSSVRGILKLLLLTLVQMGAVALLLIKVPNVQNWIKTVLIVFSLMVAAMAVFQSFFLDIRAKMVLKQRERNDAKGAFWMEHKLSLHDNIVRVSYGDQKAEVDARQISNTVRLDTMTLIRMGWNVFEMVPKSVYSVDGSGEMEDDL